MLFLSETIMLFKQCYVKLNFIPNYVAIGDTLHKTLFYTVEFGILLKSKIIKAF